jgi:hypothetical protein
MPKKYSLKFWIIFWTLAAIFLAGFYFALKIKNQGLQKTVENLPISEQNKAALSLAEYFLKQDNQERTFLVLFQNNMELRPGGGFIGSFGILKTKNGKIEDLKIHDSGNFDERIPSTVEPPYPMRETLRIGSWKLRDSNYSPDFPTNARKAEEFYLMGGGQEKIDGIIGITADVLISFLKATGPIQIPGYPGEYGDKNAIISLEYQVEKAYLEQGIEKGDRKSVMNDLAKEIIKKVFAFNNTERLQLSKIIFSDLDEKNIQLYFKNSSLQNQVEKAGWSGALDKNWEYDFLMPVDANLGAFKSDYFIKRSVEYNVDFSRETPEAILKITYNHTATQKDWMTRDYLTYLRVYLPNGAWFISGKNFDGPRFGEDPSAAADGGKKYVGALVKVPLGTSKTVEIRYSLPRELKNKPYQLKIQKQSGTNDTFYTVNFQNENKNKSTSLTLDKDEIVSF